MKVVIHFAYNDFYEIIEKYGYYMKHNTYSTYLIKSIYLPTRITYTLYIKRNCKIVIFQYFCVKLKIHLWLHFDVCELHNKETNGKPNKEL